MGLPTLYWYPLGASTYESITLPRCSRLEDAPFRDCTDSVGDYAARLDRGGGRQVRIVVDSLTKASNINVIKQLRTLDTHLRAGGRVAFGLRGDDDMYLAQCTGALGPGDVSVLTGQNVLPYGSWVSTAGRTMRASHPDLHLDEYLALSSITPQTLDDRIIFADTVQQTLGDAIVRYEHCYPVLRLPREVAESSARWLSDEGLPGFRWDMDLTLEELPEEVWALTQVEAEQFATATNPPSRGGLTTEQLLQLGAKDLRGGRSFALSRHTGRF